MPCMSSDGMDEAGHAFSVAMEAKRKAEALEAVLIPLLCSASRALERVGYDFDENPALAQWWAAHKREDEQRIEREQQAEAALRMRRQQLDAILAKPFGELSQDEVAILRREGII